MPRLRVQTNAKGEQYISIGKKKYIIAKSKETLKRVNPSTLERIIKEFKAERKARTKQGKTQGRYAATSKTTKEIEGLRLIVRNLNNQLAARNLEDKKQEAEKKIAQQKKEAEAQAKEAEARVNVAKRAEQDAIFELARLEEQRDALLRRYKKYNRDQLVETVKELYRGGLSDAAIDATKMKPLIAHIKEQLDKEGGDKDKIAEIEKAEEKLRVKRNALIDAREEAEAQRKKDDKIRKEREDEARKELEEDREKDASKKDPHIKLNRKRLVLGKKYEKLEDEENDLTAQIATALEEVSKSRTFIEAIKKDIDEARNGMKYADTEAEANNYEKQLDTLKKEYDDEKDTQKRLSTRLAMLQEDKRDVIKELKKVPAKFPKDDDFKPRPPSDSDDEEKDEASGEGTIDMLGEGKSDALYGSQIDQIMSSDPSYIGVTFMNNLASEVLKYIDNDKVSIIVNTLNEDSPDGSVGHYIAVILDNENNSLSVFDPLAENPSTEMMNQLTEILNHTPEEYQLKINAVQQQGIKSTNCGYHCALFLTRMANGDKFADATYFSKVDNTKEGDGDAKRFQLKVDKEFEWK